MNEQNKFYSEQTIVKSWDNQTITITNVKVSSNDDCVEMVVDGFNSDYSKNFIVSN